MDTDRNETPRTLNRRRFLQVGGAGALGLAAGAGWAAAASGSRSKNAAPAVVTVQKRLAATDGHILLPGRGSGDSNPPVYVFGFHDVPVGVPPNELDIFKGNVRFPAPTIAVDQNADVYITVTNLGLVVRPDLSDAHTVHWHGFPNQNAIFDGVPEVSISVPPGRDFPYFFRPRRVGTFMYHCHFEDVEHVQMGMQGSIWVRPSQNGQSLGGYTKFAYNDGDGSTGYNREFAMLLDEIWTQPHDNLEAIQETIWTDYDPNYWTINGRCYPDTVKPGNDASLEIDGEVRQPISSLIQVNPGDRVLLRFANLGYQQHAMQLPGIRMKVVGEDAALLRGPGGADLSYNTNTVYIGPGEARDTLFTAPSFNGSAQTASDGVGTYNRYLLKNADVKRLSNGGEPGLGGHMTEVRVYQGSPVPAQVNPNETYP